jgi:hypothetical protein
VASFATAPIDSGAFPCEGISDFSVNETELEICS